MNLQPLLKVKNNKTSEIVLENVYTFDFKTKHCTWWKEQEK